jgi:hypothetical protein
MPNRKRGISRTIASVTVGAIVALGAAAQSASALTLQSASGSPGWISARTDAITQDTSDAFTAATHMNAAIGLESLALYASPASSQTQVVQVTEHVWAHWLNGWIHEGASTRTYYVAPGAWRTVVANASGAPVFGWFGWNGKYFYLPQLEVTWRTPSGGFLGHKVVNYDAASDQHCLTVGCRENDGWGYSFYPTYVQY